DSTVEVHDGVERGLHGRNRLARKIDGPQFGLLSPETVRGQVDDRGAAAADDGVTVAGERSDLAGLPRFVQHFGLDEAVELRAIDFFELQVERLAAEFDDERFGHGDTGSRRWVLFYPRHERAAMSV